MLCELFGREGWSAHAVLTVGDGEQALERLRGLIGFAGDWADLMSFLPDGWGLDPARRRSATAATFAASLELARQGRIEIRQTGSFAPISFRRKTDTDPS